MKKTFLIKSILTMACCLAIFSGCKKDFLDFTPTGAVSEADLNTVDAAEKLVIAAYAALGNDGLLGTPFEDMWSYGSVRSGDAYKGGGSIGDQFDTNMLEVFNINTPSNGNSNLMWTWLYAGVGRCNEAIRRIQALDDAAYLSEAKVSKAQRIAEMRFVRGHFEFILKTLWKYPVFLDETIAKADIVNVGNRVKTDQEGWQLIADEFREGVNSLPATQADKGRPSKDCARAYLAKVLLYKAYVQDDKHKVTSITASELTEVVSLIQQVEDGGSFGLYDDFAKNFLWEFESGKESVWAVMRSINDGSPEGRGNFSTGLTSSLGPGYGCCSFNQGSQNLLNAFKTDANGLPFDGFNSLPFIETVTDVKANNMDPRLAHTLGVIGMPFKYDPKRIYDETYARVPGVYGYNLGMKDQELPTSPAFRQYQAFFSIARNTDQIRFGDLILMKAEALIELNQLEPARTIINQIRARAIAPASLSRIADADGNPTGKWVVGQYDNAFASQDAARKALRWERRLELAFESKRFFDLVRWGIAEPTLNQYFAEEKGLRPHLNDAHFTAGRDEYLPIPQQQITIVGSDKYIQNPGY